MTVLPSNIIEAMTSPDWWGPWFRRGDWSRWHAFLRAAFGLPMDEAATAIYAECTGRAAPPAERARETWAICGRRGGKTRIKSTVAARLAAFEDWQGNLAPGEVASVLLVAKDRRQAAVAFRYLRSLFTEHPVLCGFDGDTSANPAEEILAAVKPAMLTMPNSILMAATDMIFSMMVRVGEGSPNGANRVRNTIDATPEYFAARHAEAAPWERAVTALFNDPDSALPGSVEPGEPPPRPA
jgi:hypothetical protein